MDRSTKTGVQTQVETLTKGDARQAIQMGRLSEEEERVVRMRFGISEPPTALLARRGLTNPETRARLALMEANLVSDRLPTASGNPVKDRIIARLKQQ